MDDPRCVGSGLRARRLAGWLWVVACAAALLAPAARAVADERLVAWLQEGVPEDAPPDWSGPTALEPVQPWTGPIQPFPVQAYPLPGMPGDPLPSSRRRFQVVN